MNKSKSPFDFGTYIVYEREIYDNLSLFIYWAIKGNFGFFRLKIN